MGVSDFSRKCAVYGGESRTVLEVGRMEERKEKEEKMKGRRKEGERKKRKGRKGKERRVGEGREKRKKEEGRGDEGKGGREEALVIGGVTIVHCINYPLPN